MLEPAGAIFRKVLIKRKSIFGHCVPKHLGGVLCIYKQMYFYCCTSVGINVMN